MSKIFTVLEHSNIYIKRDRDFSKNILSERDRDYLLQIEFQKKRIFEFVDSRTIRTSSIVGSISLKDRTIIEILPKVLKGKFDS